MRKLFWIIYIAFVSCVAVFALAVGGVNKQLSEINLLFVKLDVKVAAIMGVSILLGALIMSLFWGFVVIKQRFTIANLRYKLKQIEKNEK
ncbi:MAG: LapA family protein [Succinivibrionaceae bacterium]|nr:LapA family protein [Succinivibrionaceae bacterium]